MRICVVSKATGFQRAGGLEIYLKKLYEKMVAKGNEVFFVTLPLPIRHRIHTGIYIESTPQCLTNRELFDVFLAFNVMALFKFLQLNRRHRFHIVHCHGNGMLGLALLKKLRLLRIPIIYSVHGGAISGYRAFLKQRSDSAIHMRILYALFCRIEAFWCHQADGVIATNSRLITELQQYYRTDSEKLYLILDSACEQKYQAKLGKRPFLLCVGRLVKTKNFDKVVIAMKNVIARYPYLKLIIVGDGPQRETLGKLIDDLGLKENITLRGWVPERELNELYETAYAVVHPSLVEGVSNVITEAFAHGTFVIASKESGILDVIENKFDLSYVLEEATPSRIADHILRFLREKAGMLDELSIRIRKHSLKYTYELNAVQHLQFYKQIIRKSFAILHTK